MRRVEDVGTQFADFARDGVQLSERVVRCIEGDVLERDQLFGACRRENEILVGRADLLEAAEETADVGADSVVGDIAAVDHHPHRAASASSCVISCALASQR